MTIQTIYQELDNKCTDAMAAINSVNNSHYLSSDELKTIRDLVVKQAFVSVFTEWEHFLENSTAAYALGELSIAGHAPVKYISPIDVDHVNQLAKGASTYPDWSKTEVVLNLERAFFKDGEPFTSAIQGFASKDKDMKKVRNVIVHNSIKSRDEFDSLVRTALRASAVGISPSEFLLSRKTRRDPYFYEMYITHIRNAATLISQYSPPEATTEATPDEHIVD